MTECRKKTRKRKTKNKKSANGGFFVGVWLQLGSRERANPPNAYIHASKL